MTTDKRARQKANRASRVAAAESEAARTRMKSRFMTYGAIALAIVVAIIGVSILTSNDDDPAPSNTGADPTETLPPTSLPAAPIEFVYPEFTGEISDECPAADGSAEQTLEFAASPPVCIDPAKAYTAVFDTSEGEIRVALDAATTPYTVNNFVYLSRFGYYDGTVIHRTDPSIDIIQGGSPHTASASDPGPGYTIIDEPTFAFDQAGGLVGPYRYVPGQLVMARSAGPDSAGAQFFFVTGAGASALDGQGTYVVFGNTDESGLGVLETIIGLHEDDPTSGLGGAPSREVLINSVTIEEA